MSADEVERALQRFERVENPNLASAGGLGVGLPLAKQMIELQGGTFNIRSTKGEGTSVILTLPLAMPLTHKAIA